MFEARRVDGNEDGLPNPGIVDALIFRAHFDWRPVVGPRCVFRDGGPRMYSEAIIL